MRRLVSLRLKLILVLVSLFSIVPAFAIEPVALHSFDENGELNHVITLEGQWQYFINEEKLDFSQAPVLSEDLNWQVEKDANANYSYDEREYWLNFSVINNTNEASSRIIQIAYPLLDELEMLVVEDGVITESTLTGDSDIFSERPVAHPNFIFPIKFAANDVTEIYLRVKTESTVQIPLTIQTERDFWIEDRVDTYMDGLFFGAIGVMVLYNLFIFFSVRDRAYLFYVLYMVSMIIVQAANRGVGFQYFWPASPYIQGHVIVPSLACAIGFASLYFMSLLNLKEASQSGYTLFKVGITICFLCVLSPVVLPYATALTLTAIVSFILGGFGSLLAFKIWRAGNRLAAYYISGWSVLILAFFIYIASVFDFIPRNFFVEYATMFAAIAEVVIFSIALADRINIERQARMLAQKKLLEGQQKINRDLEVRVKERTQALEDANAKLQDMSFTDGLTSVKNRRYFDEHILIEYKRAYRERIDISLLLVDIDHFKPINDNYGHQVGDDCLRKVAAAIKETVKRPADAVARYGGEEFTILLPDTSYEGAGHVAERVRQAVEALRFTTSDGEVIPLNISVGVASYIPKLRDGVSSLIQLADESLYKAKESGRNCCVISVDEKTAVSS